MFGNKQMIKVAKTTQKQVDQNGREAISAQQKLLQQIMDHCSNKLLGRGCLSECQMPSNSNKCFQYKLICI